jgi:hypothetical protein
MSRRLYAVIALVLFAATAPAYPAIKSTVEWHRFADPQSGTSVDIPVNIFSDDGPAQYGSGRQFANKDGRSRLAVYSLPNPERDSPASYLRKHLTVNAGIFDYRRVAARFFVVSGVRRGSVFYSRCNFRKGKLGCMFIQYPEAQKRAWDRIVTRMSLSLR